MLRGNWLIVVAVLLLIFGLKIGSPSSEKLHATNGNIDLNEWLSRSNHPAKLDGDWKFFPNQLITPADYAQANGTTTARVPSSWNQLIGSGSSTGVGFGTYALQLHGSFIENDYGLLLQPICGASEVYFFNPNQTNNNAFSSHAVGGLGNVTTTATNSRSIVAPQLVALNLSSASTHVLLVQVSNYEHGTGGLCQEVLFGKLGDLYAYHNQQLLSEGLVVAVIFSIAIYAFGMYFQYHTNAANLWLGLWTIDATLFFWTRANFWEIGLGNLLTIGHSLHYKIEYITMALLGPLGVYFYRYTFNSPHMSLRTLRYNVAVTLLLSLVIALVPTLWFSHHLPILFSFIIIEMVLIGYIMVRAVLDKVPEATLLLISVLPMLITVPLDFALRVEILQGEYLSQYAWLFFMFMHCMIQSRRLTSAIDYTNRMSQTLALEVEKKTESLEEKNRQLLMVQNELRRANHELKALSVTDGLTGTYNRLYFDRQFQVEWQRSRREQEPFSIVLLDIDHFKQVNDQYGHMAGDQCLKSIAKWIEMIFKRSNDVVCRYGGEEFAILLPNTAAEQALVAAEQLRKLIADTPVKYADIELQITISVGVAGSVPQQDAQPTDLLRAADTALYGVKRHGRNGVKLANLSNDRQTA